MSGRASCSRRKSRLDSTGAPPRECSMMNGRLADLGAALKSCERLGYDEAWSMPRAYYTDPAVLKLEREHLFAREWICLGRVEEIPSPGDFMTFQLCDEPLIAVRGHDGVIRSEERRGGKGWRSG